MRPLNPPEYGSAGASSTAADRVISPEWPPPGASGSIPLSAPVELPQVPVAVFCNPIVHCRRVHLAGLTFAVLTISPGLVVPFTALNSECVALRSRNSLAAAASPTANLAHSNRLGAGMGRADLCRRSHTDLNSIDPGNGQDSRYPRSKRHRSGQQSLAHHLSVRTI